MNLRGPGSIWWIDGTAWALFCLAPIVALAWFSAVSRDELEIMALISFFPIPWTILGVVWGHARNGPRILRLADRRLREEWAALPLRPGEVLARELARPVLASLLPFATVLAIPMYSVWGMVLAAGPPSLDPFPRFCWQALGWTAWFIHPFAGLALGASNLLAWLRFLCRTDRERSPGRVLLLLLAPLLYLLVTTGVAHVALMYVFGEIAGALAAVWAGGGGGAAAVASGLLEFLQDNYMIIVPVYQVIVLILSVLWLRRQWRLLCASYFDVDPG